MYRNDQIKAEHIAGVLRHKHRQDICLEEVRLSSGFQWQGRIDFLAIDPSPAKGNPVIAYEIKVSKADFRRDTHDKQRGARLFSDKFYYVAPEGVILPENVPDWAGLREVCWETRPYRDKPFLVVKEAVPAPKRDKDSPSWGLICSLIRNVQKQESA